MMAEYISTPEDTPVDIILSDPNANQNSIDFYSDKIPSNGAISGTPPNIIYTPNVNFFGKDSFSFMVTDSNGYSEEIFIIVTVLPLNDFVVFVDKDWTGNQFGTFENPYNTISKGYDALVEGGTLYIKSNSYDGAFIFDKKMTVETYDGATVMGQ